MTRAPDITCINFMQ